MSSQKADFPHPRPGDRSLSAAEMNNLSRAVESVVTIAGGDGQNVTYTPWGVTTSPRRFPRQPVAGVVFMRIGAFGTGLYQLPNSSFLCYRVDSLGASIGPQVEVLSMSYHPDVPTVPIGAQDLTLCLPGFGVGHEIPVMAATFRGSTRLFCAVPQLLDCPTPGRGLP